MAPSAQSHSRNHSLLLLQKLLNLRDSASPLTLILDTVEQSATPLLNEFVARAKVSYFDLFSQFHPVSTRDGQSLASEYIFADLIATKRGYTNAHITPVDCSKQCRLRILRHGPEAS